MRRTNWLIEGVLTLLAVAVIGGIALVISPDLSSSGPMRHAGMQGMNMPGMSGAQFTPHSDGLSDSESGYRLVTTEVPKGRGEQPVAFKILGPSGRPETSFPLNMTKQLHFLVARDDMAHFQHVHPQVVGDTWRTTVNIPDGGTYRMYAEFVSPGTKPNAMGMTHPLVLGESFIISGDTEFRSLPEPSAAAKAGDVTVTRPDGPAQPIAKQWSTLRFRFTDDRGKPVTDLQPYLGSWAHMSAFHTVTLGVTHMHPVQRVEEGSSPRELTFRTQFAERGEHRMFLEFKVDGQVRTAEFTVFVT